ncbi:hypothetical protein [Propionicimonas sp.]|uniref:hypothetical protein n=1 Tax=Propionicimonas sp. TaxID=1955623 RepID=UPI00180C696C|nr:hypothetical protein [Propionicimonas sp.]MBU3975931.1 hypothetical protein [Actinomycetota bacterium]MBA3020747.1 hypothetical protein [Propionicimonas sp.]MBU3985121.1 hypothetical protein [Actinomycetota bacterium]MBU4008111.1 hypothetical protein [Actinomycetota bacterium]MBU4064675.1 hypothetical protein [Actinomycetota bacterium]
MSIRVVASVGLTAALLLAPITLTRAETANPEPRPTVSVKKGWIDGINQRKQKRRKKALPGANSTDSSTNPNPGSTATTDPLDKLCSAHGVKEGKYWCVARKPGTPSPDPQQPTASQIRKVVAKLKLPNPTPRFGPDPSVNEWNMLAVGFPIWLWTDQPTRITTTAHHDGLTFQLTATWQSTTFNMGDGQTKTCTTTTVYPPHIDKPGRPSPTCGYVYETRSPKGHPYTVTADTHWRIDWATNGYSGTFNHTYTGNRTLDVGELQSMING